MSSPRKAPQIYAATLDLLGEIGFDAVTIDAVAERAGVNKTTVYRSWPSKDVLIARAVTESAVLEFPMPDTGSLRGDLEELASGIARLLDGPGRGAARALSAASNTSQTGQVAARFFADRLQREQAIFDRARVRGELHPAADGEYLMDLLGGALWFRLVVRSVRVDAGDIRALVDAILTAADAHTGR